MLILVRHGHTAFNEDGSERLRGWLPVPLTMEGIMASVETAEELATLGDAIDSLYCSDLVRCVQTAQEIAHSIGQPLQPKEELRDWHIGDLAGEDVESALSVIHKHMDEPSKVLPSGESFKFFLERCIPYLDKLVRSNKVNIAVSHNRVLTLAKALSLNDGDYPDMPTLKKKGPVDPAGFLVINPDWSIAFATSKD